MNIRFFLTLLLAGMVLPGWGASTPEEIQHEKARMIVGISNGSSCGPKIPVETWNPLNDKDREYSGPVEISAGSGYGGGQCGNVVSSYDSLVGIVERMASTFCEEKEIEMKEEATTKMSQWLQTINTCLCGRVSLQKKGRGHVLKVHYTSADRIHMAFRYPCLKEKLTEREQETLRLCISWICDNIQGLMPAGLKVKKVHDALIDCSLSSLDRHDAMDVILDGEGSSQAYASACQLLLSMMQFDCRLVQGRMKKNHCWNMVNMGKKNKPRWFHLDIFSDDSLRKAKGRRYDYCLLTDAEMAPDHHWDTSGVYPETPKMASARYYLRNELRRAWTKDKNNAARSDRNMVSSLMKRSSDATKKHRQMLPVAGLQKTDSGKDSQKKQEVRHVCATSDDVNRLLAARLKKLDDSPLLLVWTKGVPEWRVRQMLVQSELQEYAENYCVVYNEEKGLITVNFEFSPHRRVLAAAQDPDLMESLPADEKGAVEFCKRLVADHAHPWKSKRRKVQDLYMAHVAPADAQAEDSAAIGIVGALSYAQSMYVVCHLIDVPCRVVSGRTKEEYHSWNVVCLDKSQWQHLDAALDARTGQRSEYLCKYLFVADSKMKKTHAWDESEFSE